MSRGGHNKNTPDEFWSRVRKGSDCWLWLGRKVRGGYGHFDLGGKTWLAHRLAYALVYGAPPDNTDILHRCDNPSCVRPDHLFPGTHMDNMQDMRAKGRGHYLAGETHASAKLTWDQVCEIRRCYANGETQLQIAAKFNTDNTNISLIVRCKTWKVPRR